MRLFSMNSDEADDWIELYNNSSNVIYLEGLYLSDNSDEAVQVPTF
jgi:hypothetical protein